VVISAAITSVSDHLPSGIDRPQTHK
jgi:hypothetical protein